MKGTENEQDFYRSQVLEHLLYFCGDFVAVCEHLVNIHGLESKKVESAVNYIMASMVETGF